MSSPNRPDPEIIHAIGVWGLRGILAIGCIVAALMGNEGVAVVCGICLFWSFILLDS